jgi:hypothetical protein
VTITTANADGADDRSGLEHRVGRVLRLTDTVTIATRRGGRLVPTFIWSVVVDGRGYVRSAFGPRSKWYERALATGALLLDLDAAPADTEGTPAPDLITPVELRCVRVTDVGELDAVDAAYREKYGYDPTNLAPAVSSVARDCTLRLGLAR